MLEFDDNETIVQQGEMGDCLFIIASGSVKVTRRQPDSSTIDVATLHQGECFGEVALLTGEPRSADVVATGVQTVVLRLSRERFNALMKQDNVLAIKIAGILAQRIRRTTGQVVEGSHLPQDDIVASMDSEVQELPSSNGLQAGWTLGVKLRSRRVISTIIALTLCSLATVLLKGNGMTGQQVVLFVLLMGATVVWSFDAFSYHAVALALPLAAVLLNVASPSSAFAGFSHPSWFLVLGVFAISAAISRTGLMYRLVLIVMGYFPTSYRWQSFGLAVAGLILTPVIPSSNGRAVLSGPLVSNLSEILRFRRGSAGSIGMSMAALLGFGHMSFMFMNGTATCLLAFGLLPAEAAINITCGSWLWAALPMGLTFFILSYCAVVLQYQPKVQRSSSGEIIKAQLKALGPCDTHEVITITIVLTSLAAFMTQSWHHVNGAWVALASFFLLFSSGVLGEKSVRSDIDWNFLLSFGALVGFGGLISSSGLGRIMASKVAPMLAPVEGCPYAFLVTISLGMFLLRFVLPLPAAQLVALLSVLPVVGAVGVDPFVLCLVVLISGNPWFFPYQNSVYFNLLEATEGKVFDHHQTRMAAYAHVVVVQIAIILSIPWWKFLNLVH